MGRITEPATVERGRQATEPGQTDHDPVHDGPRPREPRQTVAAARHAGDHAGERFRTLDGLRGIAAAVVMLHHTLMVVPSLAGPHFTNSPVEPALSWSWFAAHTPLHWFWAGREAVFVFFILSGFVLTRALMRTSRQSWLAYYPSRLVRLYLPIIGAVLLGALFIRMHFDTSTNGFGVWMQYTPDVSLRAMILDATTMPDIAGPIRPLWSLRWELLFSLLLPVFYWGTLLWRRGVMVKLAVLIAVVYVGTVASASPLVFLPMFAIGALLAQELDRFAGVADRLDRGNGDVKWCALLLAGLTLLTSQWGLMLFSPAPEVGALSQPAGVAGAAILVFVTIFWPRIRVALDRRFVQWLGAVSFSLYLIHEPIAVAFGFLVGEGRGLLAVPLTIVTSLAVASLFRRLIELPSHHIARRIGVAIDGERPRDTGHADADVNNRSSDGGN